MIINSLKAFSGCASMTYCGIYLSRYMSLQFYALLKFCFLDFILPSPSVINKTIEEDRFDIPEVPMEED